MAHPKWALDKAREYLDANRLAYHYGRDTRLAALLVEVADAEGDEVSGIWSHRMSEARAEAREQTLAEVRRMVEEESRSSSYRLTDRILSRLEALK